MALQSENGVRVLPPGGAERESSMAERESRSHSGYAPDDAAAPKSDAVDAENEDAPSARAAQQEADNAGNVDPAHATPNLAATRAADAAAEKETPLDGGDSDSVEKARYTDVDRRNPFQGSGTDTGGPGSSIVKAKIQSKSLFHEDAPSGNHAETEEGAAQRNGIDATDATATAGMQEAVRGGEQEEVGKEKKVEETASNSHDGAQAGTAKAGGETGEEVDTQSTETQEVAVPQITSPRPVPRISSGLSSPMSKQRKSSAEMMVREKAGSVENLSKSQSEYGDEGDDEIGLEDDDRDIVPGKCVALFGFDAESNLELAFCEGQLMEVLDVYDDGWCMARTEKGATGLVPTAYLRMGHEEDEPVQAEESSESELAGEFAADGGLKRRPSQQGLPHLPPRSTRLGSFRGTQRKQSQSSSDEEEEARKEEARSPAGREEQAEEEPESPLQKSGTGPHGRWEIVQVISPAMANKLVLNRGAMFSKFSYKRASVGVRYKEERLVWLSGDHKIQWQDPLAPKHPAPSSARNRPNSINLKDVKQLSTTAPEHYCVDEARCIYIVTPVRSLLLEAKDTDERDFWFEQLHEHWAACQANERHKKRQQRLAQKDIDMTERRRQWLQEILPNFDKMRTTKQCKTLCWLGVPTNLRAEVWVKCIGNQLQITKDLYEIFRSHAIRGRRDMETVRRRAEAAEKSSEDETELLGSESSLKVLDKDLPRTFAQLSFFHKGGPLEQQLRDVLEAYIFYRPDVGYVQGMSYLAAMLLLTMDTFQAFVALCNLLHSHYFLSFFAMDMLQIRIRFAVFEHFFEKQLPDLFGTFESLGVTTDTYLLNWLMTLFSKSLPVDLTTRLWDNYLLNGESFMIRSALGVLKWLSQTFVDLPFEELMVTLTHLHDQDCIDEDELFDCIAAIKVTEEEFAAVLGRKKEEMQAAFSKELSVGSSFYW